MQPPLSSGSTDAGTSEATTDAGSEQMLVGQTQSLLARVEEIEHTLGAREWWQFGRAFSEAQLLSEVASLLAVVRAELDGVLSPPEEGPPNGEPEIALVADDELSLLNDPGWVQARREEAVALLSQVAAVLPQLLQEAQQLQGGAERTGAPAAVVAALGIARDRLAEACETLEQGAG